MYHPYALTRQVHHSSICSSFTIAVGAPRRYEPRRAPPPSSSRGQQGELPPAVAVEGADEVAELWQQRGEVPARRRQGGEGAEQEAQREHGCRRPHADDISRRTSVDLDSPVRARVVGGS